MQARKFWIFFVERRSVVGYPIGQRLLSSADCAAAGRAGVRRARPRGAAGRAVNELAEVIR